MAFFGEKILAQGKQKRQSFAFVERMFYTLIFRANFQKCDAVIAADSVTRIYVNVSKA